MSLIQKIAGIALMTLIIAPCANAQKVLIDKDSAIHVALKNGLKTGLKEYDATLHDSTEWWVSSLLCDDKPQTIYDYRVVNAQNGTLIKDENISSMSMQADFGRKVDRTTINTDFDFDKLLKATDATNKLTDLEENMSNPVFSDNDEWIAFEYGFRQIGIIRKDGSGFKEVCNECLYPKWLTNDTLLYFKNSEHICKKGIYSDIETRLTDTPYGYEDFQLSPDKKWILYDSCDMWPTMDSLGNIIGYGPYGKWSNLCLLSTDGHQKKYSKKHADSDYGFKWTAHSDSILFYMSGKKYVATHLDQPVVDYSDYDLVPDMSLTDYAKVIGGTFPFSYQCQLLEIDSKSLLPVRVLVNEAGRYKDCYFSHDKKYLIYLKTDKRFGKNSLWIKQLDE